jgi:hypothetical protein
MRMQIHCCSMLHLPQLRPDARHLTARCTHLYSQILMCFPCSWIQTVRKKHIGQPGQGRNCAIYSPEKSRPASTPV